MKGRSKHLAFEAKNLLVERKIPIKPRSLYADDNLVIGKWLRQREEEMDARRPRMEDMG